jgi:hypothetical protein
MVERTIFHYKCRFGTMILPIIIPPNLDLYLIVDKKQMKMIIAKYNVRVGYWASKNNV